jgi:VanZ family protein
MTRPVLLGGRSPLATRSAILWFLLTWTPVLVGLAVIGRESTPTFSSDQTSSWMRAAFQAIFGLVSDDRWPLVHHHIRKTGHFLGYGTLGLFWLRAWMLTWLVPLRRLSTAAWRSYCVVMALLCTMLTASLDEVHQSFLPSRTGLVTDIWLDTTGAVVLIMLASVFWLRTVKLPHAGLVDFSADSTDTSKSV